MISIYVREADWAVKRYLPKPSLAGFSGRELFHFAENRCAHFHGADELAAVRFDVGGAQTLGERGRDGRIDDVGRFAMLKE